MTANELLIYCFRQSQPNPQPTTAAGRFAYAMVFLRVIIVNFGMANGPAGPFIHALTARLSRLTARFVDLARKYEAGTLPPLRPAMPAGQGAPATSQPTTSKANPIARFPGGFAWLQRWLPVTVHPRGVIEQVLADPELPGLLAAAPQAGRALRPLCHMLGIVPPPILARPKRPAIPRPEPVTQPAAPTSKRAGEPRTPRPSPAPHPFRHIASISHLWGRWPTPKFA